MSKQDFSFSERITDGLQLPTDILLGAAILTLSDNRLLKVENLKGIISCEESLIRLLCTHFRIDISGTNLKVHTYSKDEAVITGRIEEIHYVARGDK